MKKILLLGLLLISPLLHAADKMPAPKVVKVTDRVYALLGPVALPNAHNQGYMVNSTVIIGDQGVILVDTGATDEVGQHLAKTIAKLTPKPVTHIINTHHHGDHTLGNIAFPGAQVISSAQCKAMVEKTGYEWKGTMETLIGRKFPNTKPVPASVTYPDLSRTDITLQGVKMTLWVPKGSHTVGDAMVYLPEDKVLVGGDILVNTLTPNLRDGNLANWIATLDEVKQFDAKAIVPGHGPLMTQADVKNLHDMMAAFYAGVEAGYKKGLTDSEIRKTLDLKKWEKLKEFDTTMGANINRAYLEVEAASF